ncbi:hypothetical protein HS088_TW12G00557 [Tripterygium wilfordii]|uniref:TLDc domain-containing protein n=1 Tax=Tripterygium wilfordii TaxID=458696 RepID=A0A7J7CZ16_TRIWF|nr:uncharacterized protein LOC120010200 [Tripterygium wilfordii]KAF5739352.1 hypothetical protein HS088_TW12G00557 [Tripterygium wilfordii]
MGASSSTEQKVSSEQREVETLAASTGALPMLQNSFAKLADPLSNSIPLQRLQQCFCLDYKNIIWEASTTVDQFQVLLGHVGFSVTDVFFVPSKEGISWTDFLRGYVKCCGRMSSSQSLNTLLRVFALAMSKAGLPLKLEFESDDADCKLSGSLLPSDMLMIFWICWTMSWNIRTSKLSKGNESLCLPDISHLVLSAVVSCSEAGDGLNLWNCDILTLDVHIPVAKFLTWAVMTVPCLTDCLTQFVHGRLQNSITSEEEADPSSLSIGEVCFVKSSQNGLLTHGRAWAISLTFRNTAREEILRQCFPTDGDGTRENLLYRSSLHGRGLNRFWSNIEGYHGPLLTLVSATSKDANEDNSCSKSWIIGALTQQGFENKDNFYGSSGKLYAISPVFHAISPSGKEKNFVYSHLHPTSRVYEPHPKPVGIAFGGTIGNERIFIDEDFARVTVRHHAVDKTYQHGSLIPHQGYLQVDASILEVEVWGLGGSVVKEFQTSYKNREQLFTEQRRKVDLKTFASWEDSPEKMMMGMISDPNAVQREDR